MPALRHDPVFAYSKAPSHGWQLVPMHAGTEKHVNHVTGKSRPFTTLR